MLGRSLCMLGGYDEAEPLAQLGRELSDDQDLFAQTLWRQVQALVHASRGEHVEAEALAREAVAMMERSDALNFQGDALRDLAEVLQAAGRSDEAAATLGAGTRPLRTQEQPRHDRTSASPTGRARGTRAVLGEFTGRIDEPRDRSGKWRGRQSTTPGQLTKHVSVQPG